MRWTKEQYDDYARRGAQARAIKARDIRLSSPQPEPDVRHEPLVKEEVARPDTRRRVSVTSYRVRLCDPDNLCVKPFIDALRYSGVIVDDTTEDIQLTVNQFKVKTRKEERTVIEVL